MKYKTKLFMVLVGLTLITNGLLIIIFYQDASRHLQQQINAKALSMVTAAAAGINGDELVQLQAAGDMHLSLYKKYETLLRKIRDANRRPDTYVKYVFTVMPDPNNTAHLVFGVDAEEAGADKSALGDVYQFKSLQPYSLSQAVAQAGFIDDQWGEWLEAHSPVYNSKGKVVGALVIDIDEHIVLGRLRHLLLMSFLALGLALLLAILLAFFLARRVTQSLEVISKAVAAIGEGDLDTQVCIKTRDEFAALGAAINNMALGLRQRDNLKLSLARYVSNQVAEKIIETGKLPEVQGERRKITVLFCDVRNFTALAERLPPEEVVALLNEAFELMIEAVFKYQGMLDKFLGDGFMAIFGAPLEDEQQEEHAVQAALAMQHVLTMLAGKWQQDRGINFHMGMGINTGVAIVGNIGSKQRMEYTAIGDTVNLAARLESATKELSAPILISENTYRAVSEKFRCKSLGAIQVKGRNEPALIYAVEANVSQ